MTIEYPSPSWRDYELIDSGNFEKLERFGRYVMIRPEQRALWERTLPEEEWLRCIRLYPSLRTGKYDPLPGHS
jgi:23S rRNA (cytosine1962-C5)-methyltransferase